MGGWSSLVEVAPLTQCPRAANAPHRGHHQLQKGPLWVSARGVHFEEHLQHQGIGRDVPKKGSRPKNQSKKGYIEEKASTW